MDIKIEDFNYLFNNLNTLLISTPKKTFVFISKSKNLKFQSNSIFLNSHIENHEIPISQNALNTTKNCSFYNKREKNIEFGSNSIFLESNIENKKEPNSQNLLKNFKNGIISKFNVKNLSFASNSISLDSTIENNEKISQNVLKNPKFASSSISFDSTIENDDKKPSENEKKTISQTLLKPSINPISLLKTLSVFERAFIGAGAGGIAGAFTYVCLHPLDTIKTKLQTKGASEIYNGAFDVVSKVFKEKGVLGFYSGVSAVIVGSTFSSAVYFGTCEFGKSVLSKMENFPVFLVPPTAGAMGNIVSSAIMVPKDLITQRMQAGAKGRSWEVLLKILEKDGFLGLYAGYSATLLRNLPAGVLSYSSFEYLKAAVLNETGKASLEPFQSVCCGALAGAISASLTTPLDVVKTRLMTQAMSKGSAEVYSGVSSTVKQILMEEGWVGFTRGMGPRVLHSACFSALGYFAFETARLTILDRYFRSKEAKELNHVSESA